MITIFVIDALGMPQETDGEQEDVGVDVDVALRLERHNFDNDFLDSVSTLESLPRED